MNNKDQICQVRIVLPSGKIIQYGDLSSALEVVRWYVILGILDEFGMAILESVFFL